MKQIAIALFFAAFLFTACGPSTKLINSWSDKDNTPKEFTKIGVTALFPSSSNRYVTELAIVEGLADKGINATPTYDIFPLAGRAAQIANEISDSEAIKKGVRQKVAENKIDGVMIISVFDETKEERWVNNRDLYLGGTGYYGTPHALGGAYYDYYYYSMGTIYNDGYYVEDVSYFIECSLYDVESEQLLWRAQTKSVNIESVEEEAKVLAYIVAKQLVNKKVVAQ